MDCTLPPDAPPSGRTNSKIALLVGDDVHAVLAARTLAFHLAPFRIYLPKTYHAFFEMDACASNLIDSSELVQHKTARFPWPKKESRPDALVKPLVSDGINKAVLLTEHSQSEAWTDPTLLSLLSKGLDQLLIVNGVEAQLESLVQPPLQVGPQALARATHAHRIKSPNSLKALVFLSTEAWLGQKPEVSGQLISWLEEQQLTATRLKLGLDIGRMCFTEPDRLRQRQLRESVSALQTCNWGDLLGYMAYADLIATDQKELIPVAKCLGKSNCKLL